jgi:hypothetical protein
MALMTLHREEFHGLNRDKFRARLAELQAQYPSPATVTFRRWKNYGAGYTFFVKGEGTPTKVQTRAHCQFCGNHQVVSEDRLVLHGYKRPGHGWIFGRCPGAGELPLQKDETITRAAQAEAAARQIRLEAAQRALDAADRAALARYEAEDQHALYLKPSKPYRYAATEEQKAQDAKEYAEKMAAWAERHPLAVAYETARDAARANHAASVQAKDHYEHFTRLLGLKLLGTPYLEVAK